LKYSYRKITDNTLVNEYFDGTSVMLYDATTWNSNGMETYTSIRDDIFQTSLKFSEENVIFYELSQIYKCNEKFCNNDATDCSPGYHTLIHGRCQCVCPENLDPSSNCKTQINGPNVNLKWPKTPMVLYGSDQCPSEFDPVPGRLSLTLRSGPRQEPVPDKYPVNGTTITLLLCTKTSPQDPRDVDWMSWPIGGELCFVRPVGVDCGGIFEEGGIQFETPYQSQASGAVGDIHVNGSTVTMNFCCKDKEHYGVTIDLPNGEPFRLIDKSYYHCPEVRGMKSTRSMFTIWSNNSHSFGPVPPRSYFYQTSFLHYQCYYQPPTYGCNERVTLNLTHRSVTIVTPGYPGHREPNRRCFYDFDVPDNVRLRLTFNSFDLHTADDFFVKRYHHWQDPYQMPNTDRPYQLISDKNYLSLQYWSSWETTDNQGVNFTVDLIPDSEMCYNVEIKGADYSGNKSVTETYEDCVPWTEAVTCEDFPTSRLAGINLLLSENHCRNADGSLLQPWCYTYVRDRMCHKRYCDVCNLYTPIDVIKNCDTLKASNPDFCASGIERFGCAQTCGLSRQTYSRAQCYPPNLAPDTTVLDGLKSVYYEGENISVICTSSGTLIHELSCSEDGWSGVPFGCNGCPSGWTEYGDRCFHYNATWVSRREAQRVCRSRDATGTLFEIRTLEDQMMIREMKENNTKDYQHGNWISGELQSQYGQWLFDLGDPMVYFNWSSVAETTSMTYNCIKLIAEYQVHNDQGGWRTLDCDGPDTASFMCQADNAKSKVCNDKIRTCSDVMRRFPDFCAVTTYHSNGYCKRSCGFCTGKTLAQCTDPSNDDKYVRTSDSATVRVGDLMTFACSSGLYHVGGDLKRACSYDGHLLGTEPICQATPIPVDLKVQNTRHRGSTLANNLAILLDHDGYRMPFNGNVTHWYYYCNSAGVIYLFIMRKSGTNYNYVGSNSVTCQPNWVMSYSVPANEQISVLEDDIYGAFTLDSTVLSISDCDSAVVKMLEVPSMDIASVLDLQDGSRPLFTGQKCAVPSLGLRLEP
ncbi:hypothetical protein Btru_004593, partial [Bulinus truncatus]